MGTNFYARRVISPATDPCPTCGHHEPAKQEERHIGKSCAGWAFALHVYPDDGIHDLPDWEPIFRDPSTIIVNEYGDNLDADMMMKQITERSADHPPRPVLMGSGYGPGGMLGPNNLMRASTTYRGVKHGAGTWDCITGDFS